MHLVDNPTPQPDQGHGNPVIPVDASDPAYVEGRYHLFVLTWNGVDGILYTSEFEAETLDSARYEAKDILDNHEGHTEACLSDADGNEVSLEVEPLAPIVYMVNFKTRRVLMCRGEGRQEEAEGRGFKKVTKAHFVKFVDNAKKGFRKPSRKGAKRK